jgi:cytochrome c peroxidase
MPAVVAPVCKPKQPRSRCLLCLGIVLVLGPIQEPLAAAGSKIKNGVPFPNPSGAVATVRTDGAIDTNNDFFRVLGTNGRKCSACHRPEDGWSITPKNLGKRFKATAGTDPIFRTNDGANSPLADVSSLQARRAAYSLLLTKGLIRIGLKVPDTAEFELVAATDPYGFVAGPSGNPELSLFRRPLPATNLKFVSAIMWDGRESVSNKRVLVDLGNQANTATTSHAQGLGLTTGQRQRIVDFETSLFTTQVSVKGGALPLKLGAVSGPRRLVRQAFAIGLNAPFLDGRPNPGFNANIFTLFDAWVDRPDRRGKDIRAAIARGQQIFNSRTFPISDVAGLNDESALGAPAVLMGTCGTCHNTPNAGGSSTPAFLNTGISDASRRTLDLPLYTFRHRATGESVQTTDPGRALVTGRWQDIGRFKSPVLRGLAARAPFFHNGRAVDVGAVVDFYESRFGLGLNNRQRLDLIYFLEAL